MRLWALALAAGWLATGLIRAQGTSQPPCFDVQVRFDGKPVEGPRTITFYTKDRSWVVAREAGCFDVSWLPTAEGTFDVSLALTDSRLVFPALEAGFLKGPWSVDLYGKGSAKKMDFPKGTRPREACRVVFHVGEPEIGMLRSYCRVPKQGLVTDKHGNGSRK